MSDRMTADRFEEIKWEGDHNPTIRELIAEIEALQAELAEFRAMEERECDRCHNIPSKVNLFSGRENCMRCNKSGTLWAKQKKEKP